MIAAVAGDMLRVLIVGQTISHYRVVELLGAGGMGEVYRAEDTRLKRSVALKFLPLALSRDADAKERLIHEAQAASALDHPNICTIHEIDETADGRLFVAMAYYEGETLKTRIARGPLPIAEAIDVASQLGRAMAAAHDAGIIHRDIKPANVIVTRRGDAKLVDFGIAKVAAQTALTRTGTTLGTVAYMAPEHIAGHAIDARADVWSLGVVLYEMLTGRQPFPAEHEIAAIRAIADSAPPSVRAARPDVPAALEAVVVKALQKDPADRYTSAHDLASDLATLRAPSETAARAVTAHVEAAAKSRRRTAVVALAAAAAAMLAAGSWLAVRASRARAARQQLSQIVVLVQQERYADAFVQLRQVRPFLSGDPEFAKVAASFLLPVSIRTDPPGAEVYWKPYADLNGEWEYLGRSPLEARGPLGYFRWRVVKAGFTTFEGAEGAGATDVSFVLAPTGSVPDGMVRVPGGDVSLPASGSISLADFFIDRYEVTNREFKKFVDAGGYRRREYWTVPFVKDGQTLSWDQAMAELRDATGRPGPSTWELGAYPDGQDDHPVRGVSWYEAAAFSRFAGKMLPTVHHWRKAAGVGSVYSEILEFSNFSGKGPARIGEYKGIAPYGAYDMAGNVKEWCWNEIGNKRYILGGGWNEPPYEFNEADARDPYDRSPNNGFRMMKVTDGSAVEEAALRPIEQLVRDYNQQKPVADDVFRAYVSLYSYDRSDLKPSVESVDDSSPAWRVERVTYAAAYGHERIIAYLFLPKNAAPPFQTVVYFPHSGGLRLRSFQQAEMSYLGFIVKAGRALLFPMYKGTYERRLVPPASGPSALRDMTIEEMKDVRRSLDYLETRQDIDRERIAYFGVSMGARLGSLPLALDKRFKTAVLWSGGFATGAAPLPEVDPINFAPRVTTPVLMLNGRDDFDFPIETSQKPMFRMLGTPDADKRHVLFDGGHVFPFARVEKDTLDWLDRYFGAPR